MVKEKVRRIRALVIKEFFQAIRDPSCILIAGLLPLVLLFIYGVGVSLDITDLQIGIAIEDDSELVYNFVESLKNSRYFSVDVSRERKSLVDKLEAGTLKGIVVIPSYFTKFYESGQETAPIQVIADGSSPNTASFVQNYVRATWLKWVSLQKIDEGKKTEELIQVLPRFWYNEELNSHYFLVPGSISIIMTLIGTLLTALVVSREWERGTMESLLTTPMTIGEFYLSKLILYFGFGFSSMVMCTLVTIFFYGVPFRGSFLMLALVSSVFLLSALGMGLLISTVARNQFVASQAAVVSSFLPSFILSGFIFEISSMPVYIQIVTNFVPARYFVTSLQTLFLVGNVWSLLFINIFALVLFSSIMFVIIKKVSRKRLD